MGVGGMAASLLGGYMTENYHPKYSFLLYSLFGFVVVVFGLSFNEKR